MRSKERKLAERKEKKTLVREESKGKTIGLFPAVDPFRDPVSCYRFLKFAKSPQICSYIF